MAQQLGGAAPSPVFIPAASTAARSSSWQVEDRERWYWNANVWVEYLVDFGPGGAWTLAVTAGNQPNATAPGLPAGYAFNLAVTIDGQSQGSLLVPGSTTTYQTGTKLLTVPPGVHTLRLTWTNDVYRAGQYDANLRLKELHLTPPAIGPPVATPTITPPGGTFADLVLVTLADAVLLERGDAELFQQYQETWAKQSKVRYEAWLKGDSKSAEAVRTKKVRKRPSNCSSRYRR